LLEKGQTDPFGQMSRSTYSKAASSEWRWGASRTERAMAISFDTAMVPYAKQDDPAQFQRFLDLAKEIGADEPARL
jgi:hypothetical protein